MLQQFPSYDPNFPTIYDPYTTPTIYDPNMYPSIYDPNMYPSYVDPYASSSPCWDFENLAVTLQNGGVSDSVVAYGWNGGSETFESAYQNGIFEQTTCFQARDQMWWELYSCMKIEVTFASTITVQIQWPTYGVSDSKQVTTGTSPATIYISTAGIVNQSDCAIPYYTIDVPFVGLTTDTIQKSSADIDYIFNQTFTNLFDNTAYNGGFQTKLISVQSTSPNGYPFEWKIAKINIIDPNAVYDESWKAKVATAFAYVSLSVFCFCFCCTLFFSFFFVRFKLENHTQL